MRKQMLFMFLIMIALSLVAFTSKSGEAKYIGADGCKMCHKEKTGDQYKIWSESKHANAYKALLTDEANKIAKEKGFGDKAAEAAECLKCHVTAAGVDASRLDKKYSKEDGVACESCHGAGSEYKSMKVMKDHAASVAAGMTDYKDAAAIEAQCKTCHNEESPTFKGFDFAKNWEKIKHPIPEEK